MILVIVVDSENHSQILLVWISFSMLLRTCWISLATSLSQAVEARRRLYISATFDLHAHKKKKTVCQNDEFFLLTPLLF